MDPDSVLSHKHAKKELGQYPAILTSNLVNNQSILSFKMANKEFTLWKKSTSGNPEEAR